MFTRILFFLVMLSSLSFAQLSPAKVQGYLQNILSDVATVEADLLSLENKIGTLSFSAGIDTFSTTDETDTVLVTNGAATDIYIVTAVGDTVDQQDVLQVEPMVGKFVVHRLASGASGLIYNWLRISGN